jgi:hypothetical protein
VPPIPREPPLKAPVLKVTVPRLPEIGVELPFQPSTAIRVDPVSVSPAFDPDKVPLPLLKSTEVVADAKFVKLRKESSITLMKPSFTQFIDESSLTIGGWFRRWVAV